MSFQELQLQLYKDHLEYNGQEETLVEKVGETSRMFIDDDDSLDLEGDEELERLLSGEDERVLQGASKLPAISEDNEGQGTGLPRINSPERSELSNGPKLSAIPEIDANPENHMSVIRKEELVDLTVPEPTDKTISNELGSESCIEHMSTRRRKVNTKAKLVNNRKRSVGPRKTDRVSKSDSNQKKSTKLKKSEKTTKLISIDDFKPSKSSTKTSFSAKKFSSHEKMAEEKQCWNKKNMNISGNEQKSRCGKLLQQRPTQAKYQQQVTNKTTLRDLNDQKPSQPKKLTAPKTLQGKQNFAQCPPPKQHNNQRRKLLKKPQMNKPALKHIPRPPSNKPAKKEATLFLSTPPPSRSTHRTLQRKRISIAPQSSFNVYKLPLVDLAYPQRNH